MQAQHPFHTLLPQHIPALRARAMNLARNQHRAEDLVQATLLKAWASRDSYRPDTKLRAWLVTILRNTFLSDMRKNRREVEDIDGKYAEALFESPRQEHAVALNELFAAIHRLPKSQSKPRVLMGAYGYSVVEAAAACECATGTVKSRVSRGRTVLQAALAYEEMPRLKRMGLVGG